MTAWMMVHPWMFFWLAVLTILGTCEVIGRGFNAWGKRRGQ